MIQQHGMPLPQPVSFDSWPQHRHSENSVIFAPGRDCVYLIWWIARLILNAKPGDEDLLAEIQRIEGLRRPLRNDLVMHFLEPVVVRWLQVSSNSFLRIDYVSPDDGKLCSSQKWPKPPADVLSQGMTRVDLRQAKYMSTSSVDDLRAWEQYSPYTENPHIVEPQDGTYDADRHECGA